MYKYPELIRVISIADLVSSLLLSLAFVGEMYGVARMQRQAIENGSAEYNNKTGLWGWIKPETRTAQEQAQSEEKVLQARMDYEKKMADELQQKCKDKGFKANAMQDCLVMVR